MQDYTYQDMLKMQEEAARRVREMKKRAALAVEEDRPAPYAALPNEVKHISYPVELPPLRDEENRQTEEPSENKGGLIKFLTEDKDTMLILAVLAVVSQNDSDYMTSLALLYLLL